MVVSIGPCGMLVSNLSRCDELLRSHKTSTHLGHSKNMFCNSLIKDGSRQAIPHTDSMSEHNGEGTT